MEKKNFKTHSESLLLYSTKKIRINRKKEDGNTSKI